MDILKLQKMLIFKDMSEDEIKTSLNILNVKEKTYKKNSIILHAGTTTKYMGFVLEGSVIIENNDILGNRTILNIIQKDDFFAETYAIIGNEPLLIDVRANENCKILFFKIGDINKFINEPEIWNIKLITNLLKISSKKNLNLSSRNLHTSSNTIRGKVLSFFNSFAIKKKSKEFDIPFDRQELADYLNTDRSALSKELGKMKKEKIISFRKNHFNIL